MTRATEVRAQMLSKVAEGGDFRSRLIANPRVVISAVTGVTIPNGFNVVVLEDSANTVHLVLPPSSGLTEAELEIVSGGAPWWYGGPD